MGDKFLNKVVETFAAMADEFRVEIAENLLARQFQVRIRVQLLHLKVCILPMSMTRAGPRFNIKIAFRVWISIINGHGTVLSLYREAVVLMI